MIHALLGLALSSELAEVPERYVPPPLKAYAVGMATGRIVIGAAPIVAFEPTARFLGFPDEHDNPSARMAARLFGVRDIGLGVLVLATMDDSHDLSRVFLLNAMTDVADATVIAIPLVLDQGIDTAARRNMAFALGGCALWSAGYVWLKRSGRAPRR